MNYKYIASILSFLFLLSICISFIYPPKEIPGNYSGVLPLNDNCIDCFVAQYKNTILGFVDKRKQIITYYDIPYSINAHGYGKRLFIYKLPQRLPLIFFCLILYFWIKVFTKPKE